MNQTIRELYTYIVPKRLPWRNAFSELHFGEITHWLPIGESYFKKETLSSFLLYYFKDILENSIKCILLLYRLCSRKSCPFPSD